MIKIAQLVFLFLFPLCVTAQTVDLNRTVTFRYKNAKLGYILSDISRKYSIPFSYSSNFIPVAKRITISERKVSLKEGLDRLFEPTQIVYAVIGNSVALKIDESKEVITVIETSIDRNKNIETEEVAYLKRYSYPILVWEHQIPAEVLAEMKATKSVSEIDFPDEQEENFLTEQMIQVTLVPPVSTNEELAEKTTNTFSFNVLWGRNGGLDGIEVGGFVNSIVHNMEGFQLAGVGNIVDGDAQGGQLATIFNYNKGFTKGVQASLFNIANTANVIQVAGIANIIQEDFKGLQAALVGNYARTKADGFQLSGLFNYTKGYANTQISLGLNKASEVKNLQIGLVNLTGYSKGRQIGIVNIAEQSNKTPFGLINIIKDGYNKIEVSGGDALYANVGLKMGTRKFYNIFQFGNRFTDEIWNLGYGIGTAFPLKERQHFHIEYVASHVNENEVWTKKLNLLNQFKFNFDWKLKGKGSLFLGPSWNILASKIQDAETLAVIGSNLPDYTILNTTKNNTNWKMWFGLNGGFRF